MLREQIRAMTVNYRVADRHPPLPQDLVDLLSSVETATIGHVEHLGFVGDGVRPVFPARAAGQALTVAAPGRDGSIIYRAIDLLLPGDMLVISRVDRDDIACVGGGVAVAAKGERGCRHSHRRSVHRRRRDHRNRPPRLVSGRFIQDDKPQFADRRIAERTCRLWGRGNPCRICGACRQRGRLCH